MSRSYANFLLFEDVLDNIPTTNPVMVQAVNTLLSPMVKIVEDNCGTLLGAVTETSLELEGLTDIATGDVLTPTSIRALLAQGKYKLNLRSLHACNSHLKGGICRKCYQGSHIGEVAPDVGSTISLKSSLIYQTDVVLGTGYSTKFTLSQTTDDYYDIKVLNQGAVVTTGFTLGYDYIEFDSIVPQDPVTGAYTVHFLQENTEPFQGLISKTYSGSLLGMQPLPTLPPLLRKELYSSQLSDNFIALMLEAIAPLRVIPSTYLDYLERIHDRLEKVLLILYLYALYSNVEL